jgi:hypothetical protein
LLLDELAVESLEPAGLSLASPWLGSGAAPKWGGAAAGAGCGAAAAAAGEKSGLVAVLKLKPPPRGLRAEGVAAAAGLGVGLACCVIWEVAARFLVGELPGGEAPKGKVVPEGDLTGEAPAAWLVPGLVGKEKAGAAAGGWGWGVRVGGGYR